MNNIASTVANAIHKGVPGVPLAALSAIPDQNTRQVLQAIVDGWHVRNGSSGSGSSRFITAGEFGDLSGQVGGLRNMVAQSQQTGRVMSASEISRIITDLQASVMESQLFKELGDRIALIDRTAAKNLVDGLLAEATARGAAITQESEARQTEDLSLATKIDTVTAAVGENAAAIQTETTARVTAVSAEAAQREILAARVGVSEAALVNESVARVNADNAIFTQTQTQFAEVNGNLSTIQLQQNTTSNNVAALAQTVGTLQVSVGQNTVSLQEESTVRANADNDIYAKYSVKIDNNGYVTGFGLMSTSNNSTPFSEFIVRADRFAIGSPSGPGITPEVPFIVLTTPDAKGNPPGVYIDRAMIKNADIGTAQIDDLAVNTLKIAGNAVTVPSVAKQGPAVVGNGNIREIVNVVIDVGSTPCSVFAFATAYVEYGTGWALVETRLYMNGSVVVQGGADEGYITVAHSGMLSSQTGNVNAALTFAASSAATIHNATIFIMAVKR